MPPTDLVEIDCASVCSEIGWDYLAGQGIVDQPTKNDHSPYALCHQLMSFLEPLYDLDYDLSLEASE
eukprot:CAMPEP_0173160426 /NCGR_PEP_ID=MMETSP1105-20130129/17832_1 /TAXON_ID=2985 /ORGANISM="Ochromonas sp., Strain BG-1" /LENGTH=66 /DNA_ID=CAMNT_0014079317 /DNA_START=77 /DNA_END=277 /DNA_ORIENTATION=+